MRCPQEPDRPGTLFRCRMGWLRNAVSVWGEVQTMEVIAMGTVGPTEGFSFKDGR